MISVRRKTLVTIGLTSLGLLVLLFVLAQLIILRGFDSLQQQAVEQNIQRVMNAIRDDIQTLSTDLSSWTYWDDTYQFVQDRNTAFIISNLTDSAFLVTQRHLAIFTNKNNEIIFGRLFDLEQKVSYRLPSDLEPTGTLLSPFLELEDDLSLQSGIIVHDGKPMMIAARKITTSELTGPATGVGFFGNYIDEAKIAQLSEQTQLNLAIYPLQSSDLTPDFETARSRLTEAGASETFYSSEPDAARGFTLISDVNGTPQFLLGVTMPPSIYQRGQQSVLYFAIALLIAGITFAVVIVWSLEKIVISRVSYLNRRVAEIAATNNLSDRISIDGSDELTSLTMTINNSLGVMERSQTELQQLNLQLEEKINDLNLLQTYRDRFFTNAAHEFRTPMAVLRTQLYLAEKQPALWQKHVEVLSDATKRLSDILDDVFDMAQFQRQRVVSLHQEVELGSLVADLVADARPRMFQKSLHVSSLLPEYKIYVKGDSNILEQAVQKLLAYIVNYCAPNHAIQISLQDVQINHVPMASLEVSSPNLQIDDSDLDQIFLPFYKSSEGDIRNSGLQLSITKEIIGLHHGEISVSKDDQKGICFCILLPLIATAKSVTANR